MLYSILNTMTDNKLDPNKAINIIDKFLQIYNTKYQKSGSLFESIDLKDPLSTNEKMEMFYEYMQNHKILEAMNPAYVDVCGPEDQLDNAENHDIYALVTNEDSTIKYISLSFISLLYVGVSQYEYTTKWGIVKI